ncbi:transglycosylase domain-containing protein [Uliginosibacterium sp. H3]|uniref:peptidoglycan glycosyltransferase n=1 Tax=Uliginosibacterium silvisoli TaxID=3114758 RepID=A0ABU6JYT7_9RHOO|nr:transglycosylase domain-containing protein [Uliginosibacterium sp. H3]
MKIRFTAALYAGLICGGFLIAPLQAAQVLPSFEQVKAAYVPSDAQLLDRHGEPLADLRLNPEVRRLQWVDVQTLSPAMREALLAAEDKRFFEHAGIDWKAFLGAAWQNLWGQTKRGGSTLTMQLAGLLEPELQLPGRGTSRRNLSQKWDQSLAALELEKRWSKEQILEAYLNLAPFRGDLEGIGAASQILLGVAPQSLTRREATILAALLRGPNAKVPVVARRACILADLLKDKKLCPQINLLAQNRLDAPRNVPRFALAPHLARGLLHQPGQRVTTTLDAVTQRNALGALSRIATHLRQQNASVIVLDNASSEVLAWVGALQARDADGLQARQALTQWWLPYGVEYGIEQRSHTAASLLIDANNVLDTKDARAGYSASVSSLRTAMQMRNSSALREQLRELIRTIGNDAFNERMRQLGLDAPPGPDALAGDISLVQLAGAWHSLSSGIGYVPVSPLAPDAANARRVLTPAAAFITQDMLADNAGGWRSSWTTSSPDGRQQVVMGNTDRFTVLVSLNRPERADHPDDIARSAQQLWKDIVGAIQKEPSRAPAAPDGVTSSIVVFEPPDEPVRREWFIKGTELDRVMTEALPAGARIRTPQGGQIYTLNSPVPPWTLQAFTARATRWQMDDNIIGQGAQVVWQPTAGRHRLTLLGPRDETMDAVDFEVQIAP